MQPYGNTLYTMPLPDSMRDQTVIERLLFRIGEMENKISLLNAGQKILYCEWGISFETIYGIKSKSKITKKMVQTIDGFFSMNPLYVGKDNSQNKLEVLNSILIEKINPEKAIKLFLESNPYWILEHAKLGTEEREYISNMLKNTRDYTLTKRVANFLAYHTPNAPEFTTMYPLGLLKIYKTQLGAVDALLKRHGF
jgi:intein/homing endonuclease